MTTSRYTNLYRYLVFLASAAGLIFIGLLPAHEYAWMLEMDPDLKVLPVDTKLGGRAITSALIILCLTVLHIFLAWLSKRKLDRLIFGLFSLLAIGLWIFKFGVLLRT